MAYYDYNVLSTKKVALGIVNNEKQIKRPLYLGLVQNLCEYWVAEFRNYDVPAFFDDDPDKLLHAARDAGYELIVMSSLGAKFSKYESFINVLSDYICENGTEDITIMGHILDKGDAWYELHHQTYLLNLKWWEAQGRPAIGKEEYGPNKEFTFPNVERSEDNFHDEYTPHWIKISDGDKTYTQARNGHNIIKYALMSGKKVDAFNQTFRDSKHFLYPEVKFDCHNKIGEILENLQMYKHYVANTENPPSIDWNELDFDSFDGALSTAGGLSPLLTAWKAKLKPGDRLVIADASPVSLLIQERLLKSNFDITNIKPAIFDSLASFKSDNIGIGGSFIVATNNIGRMQEIIHESPDLIEYYNNVYHKLDIQFIEINFLDAERTNNIHKWFNGDKKIFINLSNVFSYNHTSWLLSLSDRMDLELNILRKLQNGESDFYVKSIRFHRGSWHFDNVSDILADKTKQELPSWYGDIPWT